MAEAMTRFLKDLLRDRRGVTVVEYGLILAVAMLVIIAAAELLGSATIDKFDGLNNAVSQANQTAQQGSN